MADELISIRFHSPTGDAPPGPYGQEAQELTFPDGEFASEIEYGFISSVRIVLGSRAVRVASASCVRPRCSRRRRHSAPVAGSSRGSFTG
jgi:hypothetical protein